MFSIIPISNIFKDIAKRHEGHPYNIFNSFAVLDSIDEISEKSMGRTLEDYENGLMWTRGGYNPDNCAEDIRMGIMQMEAYRPNTKLKEKCLKIVVAVAQKEKCIDCPEAFKKSKEFIDIQNEDLLFSSIDQFLTYQYYDVIIKNGDDLVRLLATKDQIEYCDYFNVKSCGITMRHKTQKQSVTALNNFEGEYRIKTALITVCGCGVLDQKYSIKNDEKEKEFAMVHCQYCL